MGMGPFRLTCIWIVVLLATVILIVSVSHGPAWILNVRLGTRDVASKTTPVRHDIPQVFSDETYSRPCQGSPTSSKNISYFFRVDQTGGGDFVTVQAAVDAVPENSDQRTIIHIRAGIYEEKVLIPSNKPHITMQGAGMNATIITGNDTAARSGTEGSATVAIYADHFTAVDMGFKNVAPVPEPGELGKQAVALVICGDKAAFYDCGFYGGQDTLFDYAGRHYFKNCFIEGSIDFIFGDGRSLYEGCEIHVIAESSGSITAQARSRPEDQSGFVFMDCTIMGHGLVWLGRAWGSSSRVVFVRTYMDDIIIPAGWTDFGDSTVHNTSFYAQYKCSGPGAEAAVRVPWSYELNDADVQQFLNMDFIDGASWIHSTRKLIDKIPGRA